MYGAVVFGNVSAMLGGRNFSNKDVLPSLRTSLSAMAVTILKFLCKPSLQGGENEMDGDYIMQYFRACNIWK